MTQLPTSEDPALAQTPGKSVKGDLKLLVLYSRLPKTIFAVSPRLTSLFPHSYLVHFKKAMTHSVIESIIKSLVLTQSFKTKLGGNSPTINSNSQQQEQRLETLSQHVLRTASL